ncbi:MAG: hypothetical protein HOB32_04230 [Nitrospina sp.]|jgi:hypothetical protein|nr:hypothetical protein [Nitrospina sp.]MBT6600859.1 hypothetical protein [Nitrospina sp.]
MHTERNSVESQLLTRCNILESQVEALTKKNTKPPKNLRIKDNAQEGAWKEVTGIGKFPA